MPKHPPNPRLYSDLAELWPVLSPPEDYEAEADALIELIAAHFNEAKPTRRSVLELGAGGGHTLHHFSDNFDCTAVDCSAAMLELGKQLNPRVEAVVGDMRTLDLGRTFDVVLLHDAIDYMTTESDARAAIQTVATHLAPGGIALIAPTYTRETFTPCKAEHDQRADLKTGRVLTYLSYAHDPNPADTLFELILVYVIDDDGQVEVVEDRHTCGLFCEADWLTFLRDAQLRVQTHSDRVPGTLYSAIHAQD